MSECFVDIYCDEKTIRSVSRSPKKVFCLFLSFLFLFVCCFSLSNFLFFFIFILLPVSECFIDIHCDEKAIRSVTRTERKVFLFVCLFLFFNGVGMFH